MHFRNSKFRKIKSAANICLFTVFDLVIKKDRIYQFITLQRTNSCTIQLLQLFTRIFNFVEWQKIVEKNLENLARENTTFCWPKDTLFLYFLKMEALMENLYERQKLLKIVCKYLYFVTYLKKISSLDGHPISLVVECSPEVLEVVSIPGYIFVILLDKLPFYQSLCYFVRLSTLIWRERNGLPYFAPGFTDITIFYGGRGCKIN